MILIAPDAPELVVPVENDKEPLTPLVPASVDLIFNDPDDEAVPTPVLKLTAPPVPVLAVPPTSATPPPIPVVPVALPPFNWASPPAPLACVDVPASMAT